MEEPKDEREYIEVPDDRTPSEIEEDRQLEKLDGFLAGLQSGASVLIERTQPSWCSGLLEEIEVPEEGLTLDYLIETWGGKVLAVKLRGRGGKLSGRTRIPLNSFPPLLYGEPLKKPHPLDHMKEQEPMQNPNIIVPPQPQSKEIWNALPSILPIILQWIQNNQKQQQENLQLMLSMVGQRNSGLNDITKIGATMAHLKEMFGNQNNPGADAGAGADADPNFYSQALDVVKLMFANNGNGNGSAQQPAAGAPSHRLTAPQQNAPPPPPKKRGRGRPRKHPDNVTPIRDLPSSLAELDPHSAVETVKGALGKMDPAKRQLTIDKFLEDFYADMQGEDIASGDDDDQ